MKRVCIAQSLLAAFLASAAAGAAPVAVIGSGAAPVAHGGAYSITFMVSTGVSQLPGTTYLCKARAVPHAPALDGYSLQALPVASGMAAASRTVGSWANCTVELPFYWIGDDPGSQALLSYEIDVVSGSGAQATPLRVAEGISVPYPSQGGTARLSINLSF
jgi:hypothetical protein